GAVPLRRVARRGRAHVRARNSSTEGGRVVSEVKILHKACTCGHDHRTHRGEDVAMCLECSCLDRVPRCQNCGEPATWPRIGGEHDTCSRRCLAQLEYALALRTCAR